MTAILLWLSRDHYFFADDWDYLLTRGTVPGESLGWFAPHGDHWSTGVVLVNRVLFALFGLTNYMPWSIVVIALHLGICAALYLLLRRLEVGAWVAVAVSWTVLFYGWGAEAYLWDAAMNLTGSLLLGLLAVLALARDARPNWPVVAWALLVAALMFSGGGISAVALATVFAVLRWGWRTGLKVASVPTVAFLLWYAVFGRSGSPEPLEPHYLYLQVPSYVWQGLVDAIDHAFVLDGVGPVLLLVLVLVPFLARTVPLALRQVAAAGLCAAVLQLTLVGITRITFGFDYAGSGRYAYLTLVYLTPSLAICALLVVQRIAGAVWLPVVLVAVMFGGVALSGVDQARAYGEGAADVRGPWEGRVLGTVEAVDAGEQVLSTTTGDPLNTSITPELLASPQIREALPRRAVTSQELIDAEAMFMVGVDDDLQGLFAPALVQLKGFNDSGLRGIGCHGYEATSFEPELTLAVGVGNEISVTSASTEITTQLRRGDVVSGLRSWDVQAGTTSYVASSAKEAMLLVRFNAGGNYVICTGG